MEKILQIEGEGLPKFSAVGCHQTLTLTHSGQSIRSINGELIFVGDPTLKKFKSVIRSVDRLAPPVASLLKGQMVTVSCIQELSQRVDGAYREVRLMRMPVPGSIQCRGFLERNVTKPSLSLSIPGRESELPFCLKEELVQLSSACPPLKESWFVHFRPQLQMMVLDFSLDTDERHGKSGWSLTLEEI